MTITNLFHRRTRGPSPEAVAAVEAADRSHAQALDDLARQQRREPLICEATRQLRAHNAANGWQQWLMSLQLPPAHLTKRGSTP